MATLVLGALGSLIGGPLGGSIGALIGRSLDSRIIGSGRREGPRLTELKLTTSSYGSPIPRHFGHMRVAGQIIWATDLVEHKDKQGGGKSGPSVTTYTYSASFAVAVSSRPLLSIGRIWADGKLLRGEAGDLKVGGTMRLHSGHPDQPIDPLLAAAEPAGSCPAYRGIAYVVFEDLQLAEYGNRIPSLSFEVVADDRPLQMADLLEGTIEDCSAGVALSGVAGLSLEGSVAGALAELDQLYPVDVDACGEQITLAPEGAQASIVALASAATSGEPDDFGGKSGFERRRSGASEAPIAVLRYYDVDRDFQPGAQRAAGRPSAGQPRTIELPAAMAAGDALHLVDRATRRTDWSRQTISWRVTQLDPAVRPGAIVTLPKHPGLWRVRGWEWRASGVELMLSRASPAARNDELMADPGRASRPSDLPIGPTTLCAVELPDDGTGAAPLIKVLASSSAAGWPGASVYADHGDGALIALGSSGRSRAAIGTAANVLPPASPHLLDRHSELIVDLDGPDLNLSGATLRQLAMGANRAVLGDELIQFARAEPLGDGRWRLAELLRGRCGTEAAVSHHRPGERFMVLTDEGAIFDKTAMGLSATSSIAAIGIADPEPVLAGIALEGIASRPLAPVHGHCTTQPGQGCSLGWTRRARGQWQWRYGVDVPLGEQSENYEVSYVASDQVLALWTAPETSLQVPASEFDRLRSAAPDGWFEVRQRGDRANSLPLAIRPAA